MFSLSCESREALIEAFGEEISHKLPLKTQTFDITEAFLSSSLSFIRSRLNVNDSRTLNTISDDNEFFSPTFCLFSIFFAIETSIRVQSFSRTEFANRFSLLRPLALCFIFSSSLSALKHSHQRTCSSEKPKQFKVLHLTLIKDSSNSYRLNRFISGRRRCFTNFYTQTNHQLGHKQITSCSSGYNKFHIAHKLCP